MGVSSSKNSERIRMEQLYNRTENMEKPATNKLFEKSPSSQEQAYSSKETYAFEIVNHDDYERYIKSRLNVTELRIKALNETEEIEFKNYWRMLEKLDTLQVKFFGTTQKSLASLLYEVNPNLISLDIDFFNITNKQEKLAILKYILNGMPKLKSLRITFTSIEGIDWTKITYDSQVMNLELHGFFHSSINIVNLLKITTNIERLKISTENKIYSLAKDRIHAAVMQHTKKIRSFDLIHNPNSEIIIFSPDEA